MTNRSTATAANGWIQTFNPARNPALRLVCCPYAGASASAFAALSAALPPSVEALTVQYPGRSGQRAEPAISDIGLLAERVTTELLPLIRSGPPVAVFGHSMGSVVAFEVARRLEAADLTPVRLFVSGRRPPSGGLGSHTPHDDDGIVAELRDLGAIPERLLAKPKFREAILTVVKNDYRANSSYVAPRTARVACPVTFLFAEDDPYLDPEAALGWREHTTGEFRLARFPGGHFFLNDHLPEVVALLAEATPGGAG
ncbi:thioesterase II family protein [Streptomyces marincola]|uniref:Thioesterase n=1 Tax=Streptomyces marincola TaxID=2878388 RepID=A0A1W7CUH5_9ACTN|nr:alpha/beta fold hydrolase [Streptomyces marincola]ARQ68463.1 thioesterase [Streptomyces marincola]